MKAQQKYNLDELYPDESIPRNTVRLVVAPERSLRECVTKIPRTSSRAHAASMALQALLMVLGGVVSIAYVAALPRILQFAAIAVAGITYSLLYAFIRGIQRRG